MSIPIAYITVIIIWSTTPLGIQWSGDGVGFEFGVAARMSIGLLALLFMVRFKSLPFPWDVASRRVYLVSGISLYIAMSCVYWAAQYINSGWISVIFGLSPLFTSLFASFILGENSFSGGRLFGMALGLCGLAVVFAESINLSTMAMLGAIGVTVSAMSQSLGSVLTRKLKPSIPAISITAGSLAVALPLFILNCVIGSGWPDELPVRSLLSIVYLGLIGSAIGFPLYFYLIKNINVERIALITLITPVSALLLGAWLNDETISLRVWSGTALILLGLAIYEYGKHLPFKDKWRTRWNQRPL